MKCLNKALWSVALIAAMTLPACNRDRDGENEVAIQTLEVTPNDDAVVAADGYLVELPERESYLQRVRDAARRYEKRETSEHLRQAAKKLQEEERRAPASARAALSASSTELDRLAADLEAGADIARSIVDRAVARAHLALEEARRAATEERRLSERGRDYLQYERREYADALDGAAAHLERAARAVQQRSDVEIDAAVRETHQLAGRLRSGAAVAAGDVDRAWRRLGDEARRLRSEIDAR